MAMPARILEFQSTKPSSTMVGSSPAMDKLRKIIALVAPKNVNVLILGETGVGKELVARAIHDQSPRKQKPFVVVNCPVFAEGLIESELFGHSKGAFTGAHNHNPGLFRSANGGTIFLDEIGEMPLSMQVKILRAVETREIQPVGSRYAQTLDVRILAATNRDLKKAVQDGGFREDLYYRLGVVDITVPPLRDRIEDVPLLIDHFIELFLSREPELVHPNPDIVVQIVQMATGLPGNIRELNNLVQRATMGTLDYANVTILSEEKIRAAVVKYNPFKFSLQQRNAKLIDIIATVGGFDRTNLGSFIDASELNIKEVINSERAKVVLAARGDGKTIREILVIFDISVKGLYNLVREYDLPGFPNRKAS